MGSRRAANARTMRDTTGEQMARVWVSVDAQGRIWVAGEAELDGHRVQRRRRVPDDDRALADESVRTLNARFLVGDLDWFERARRRRAKRPAPRALAVPTLESWSARWLELVKPPEIAEHTFRNYRTHAQDLARRIGDRRLNEIDLSDVLSLQRKLRAEGRRDPTIKDRLGVLRMMIRDARLHGLVKTSPFDTELPRRRTKQQRREQRVRRVTFRPFEAWELERLLEALRAPRKATDRLWFPVTEALLLTGLRFGEAAALKWTDATLDGPAPRAVIRRALSRYGPSRDDEPTKTGAEWSIVLRAPMLALLRRQQERSYVGHPGRWIFPNTAGNALSYHNWRHRGWPRVLRRAKVTPREGDAQKALRRTYITSALVCGRNPKEISGDVGHATLRMILEQYDTFIDPANWPDEREISRLRRIYGWDAPSRSLRSPFVDTHERGNGNAPPR
jgi:site-specific recombinase XerD